MNLFDVKLKYESLVPNIGVHYIGQYGTSGYASATRGTLYHYFTNNIPITWEPLYFDNSQLWDDNIHDIVVKSLINKQLPYFDTVIMHSTPDCWPNILRKNDIKFNNKILIGYCTWETNKLPNSWVQYINNCCNEVWCPSKFNAVTFKESGITNTIRIVPHVFLNNTLPSKQSVKLIDSNGNNVIESNKYTFYTIGECNNRKGILDTITAFCQAFTKYNNVRLIVKIHHRNYSPENVNVCKSKINSILKEYHNHADIICIYDNLSNKEMLALHSIGDCYVSLTKGEGFGLVSFDAFNYAKNIIITGYGGHIDYLGDKYPGLVSYDLKPVSNMELYPHYTYDQLWAVPNIEHCIYLMKNIIK